MHHHGGGRVEALVKNDNGHGGGFAVRRVVSKIAEETTHQRMIPMYRIVEDVLCEVYYGGRRRNRVRRRTEKRQLGYHPPNVPWARGACEGAEGLPVPPVRAARST